MHLLDLPEEILLEVVSFSKAEDALELVKTCRALHHLTTTKTFWIHLVNHTSRRRPVPLPFSGKGSPSQLSNEQYRRAVLTSLKLEAKWTRAEIHTDPISSRVYRTPDYQPSGFANHRQIWVWPLSDGLHFLSMSIEYYLRLWNIETGEIEQTISVGGHPLCWDYYLDNEGVTLIANVHEDASVFDEEVFKVWRHTWEDKSCSLKVRQRLKGDIRSNFIEREHAGCVGIIERTSCFIYMVDWCTGDSVYIITPIKVHYLLSAATSPNELALYMESSMHADYYAYSFDTMTKYYATPMAHIELRPDVHIPQVWIDQGVPDNHICLPTTRHLWDGRHAVFSRVIPRDDNDIIHPLVLFGIVQSEPPPEGESLPPNRRLYIHEVSDIGIAQSPQGWDLCGMGTAGRTIVWAKPPPGAEEDDFLVDTVCMAQFPTPEEIEEEESWVSGPFHWRAVDPIVIELESSVNWDEMHALFGDDEGRRVESPMETDDEGAVTASEGEESDFLVASDVTLQPRESTQDTTTYPPLLPPCSSPLSPSSLPDYSGVSVSGSSSGIVHSDEARNSSSASSRSTPSQSSHSLLSWHSESFRHSASSVSSGAVNQTFGLTPSEPAASPATTSSTLGSAHSQPGFADADEGLHYSPSHLPSLAPSSASQSRFSESVASWKPQHKTNSVVEFKLPDWVYADHGDVYSLDLDDLNGRLFLAMADGSIVMLSFV